MAVSLKKGEGVSLTKEAPGMVNVLVGLGWKTRKTDGAKFDPDLTCFMLGDDGKVVSENHMIFYGKGHDKSPCESVLYTGDNREGKDDGDAEQMFVKLNKIPANVKELIFAVTIYDADKRKQNFGMMEGAYIRVVNQDDGDSVVAKYDLGEESALNTAVVFGKLYRYENEFKFKAVGQGYNGGLKPLCESYGVTVSD